MLNSETNIIPGESPNRDGFGIPFVSCSCCVQCCVRVRFRFHVRFVSCSFRVFAFVSFRSFRVGSFRFRFIFVFVSFAFSFRFLIRFRLPFRVSSKSLK